MDRVLKIKRMEKIWLAPPSGRNRRVIFSITGVRYNPIGRDKIPIKRGLRSILPGFSCPRI